MSTVKKNAVIANECVACGCCVRICPRNAIAIHKGVRAVVSGVACIGCGKCVRICPADVIELREVEICEDAFL